MRGTRTGERIGPEVRGGVRIGETSGSEFLLLELFEFDAFAERHCCVEHLVGPRLREPRDLTKLPLSGHLSLQFGCGSSNQIRGHEQHEPSMVRPSTCHPGFSSMPGL
jgi:hypothetical protein